MIAKLILISMYLIELGYQIAKHNKPKEGNHDAVHQFVMMVIVFILLGLGGYFNSFFN